MAGAFVTLQCKGAIVLPKKINRIPWFSFVHPQRDLQKYN